MAKQSIVSNHNNNNCIGEEENKGEEELDDHKKRIIGVVYPRFLYMFSDIICYPFGGSISNVESYKRDLLAFASIAAARTVNKPIKPILCIIFNQQSYKDCQNYLVTSKNESDDRFDCISRSTHHFRSQFPALYKELLRLFFDIHIIYMADYSAFRQFDLFSNFLEQQQRRIDREKRVRDCQIDLYRFVEEMWEIIRKLNEDPLKAVDLFHLFSVPNHSSDLDFHEL